MLETEVWLTSSRANYEILQIGQVVLGKEAIHGLQTSALHEQLLELIILKVKLNFCQPVWSLCYFVKALNATRSELTCEFQTDECSVLGT